MFRSYGTPTLCMRAVGSYYFVELDFSPIYSTKHEKRAVRSVHFELSIMQIMEYKIIITNKMIVSDTFLGDIKTGKYEFKN